MNDLRTAAQRALAACKLIVSAFDALKPASAARNEPLQINAARASITALEAALAEPVQQGGGRRTEMSTDAARTKLRELIATKQQWLRQWQAPELLSPGRSDMVHILSDNIAELQQVLAELAKAEPQEPDSPERRCGGPGCDMTCCQPVQEPVAGVVLNEEGRAALVEHGREEWHCVVRNARRLYTAPPQRLPLTSDKDRPDQGATYVEGYGYVDTRAVRAIERAHKIGGEG